MASTTANTLITLAYQLLGVVDPEETPSASLATQGFTLLNQMMGQWSIQHFTIPTVNREVYPIVGGQATYTYGPGGNFDSSRPASLTGAGLILTNSTPNIEIPRALLTDDAWQAIQVKSLTNPLFTDVYYNPTFTGGLGTVTLWPVPDGSQTIQIALYRLYQLGLFSSLTASYDLPEGADAAIQFNLAVWLAPFVAVPVPAPVQQIAQNALRVYKRSNVKMSDLSQDLAFTHDQRYGYNIQTGTGGGGGS